MIIDSIDTFALIPQKAPMAMVDGLLHIEALSATSRLILTPENIFCKGGFFHEPGLIENMAQTAALKASYEASAKNEAAKTGFIGSVKSFKIYRLPTENDTIQTTISIITQIGHATVIKGEIKVGELLMAEGEMSIFNQE